VWVLPKSSGAKQTKKTIAEANATFASETKTATLTSPTTQPETPIGKRGFVRDEGLNLREKPDQKSSSLGQYTFGSKVLVVAKTGDWFRVVTDDGKSGYMLAAKIHGLSAQHQAMLEADPGLRLFRVAPNETGVGLVKRAYGITGAEGGKDQNLWHFLNAIRSRNQAQAFGFKGKGWGDAIANFLVPGADANNVLLKANYDLWIPSFTVAARDSSVGSGTLSGEAVRLKKNIEQKIKDFQAAQAYAGRAMPGVFARRLEEGAQELIEGLITALIGAAAVLVTTTAIGAIVGAFAGGVGAAPGAALGFEIGTWILQYLGLGFLIVWAGSKLVQVFGALGTFVSKVWTANGDQQQLEAAGVALADALAVLAVSALQILVTIGIAKGLGAATRGLANSRFGKAIGIPKLTAYLKGKLEAISRTAGSTPRTAPIQQGLQNTTPKALVNRVRNRPATPAATQQGNARVRTPINGLYQSVDTSTPPKGWSFRDASIRTAADGTKTLSTEVTGPKGESGVFVRSYNPKTQKVELLEAFLEDLPKWVDTSTPLVPGKGTPTVTYMTLYQMRRLGVSFGGLKTVKMSTIQNFEAILQLETFRRQGMPLDRAVLKTHSVQYADTSIIQSGHQISGAKVITTNGAEFRAIGDYMSFYERRNPALKATYDALLSKYGMQRTDKMWLNYDIELQLKPLAPGQNAQPLGVK
jgi:hypothetical protein